MGTFLASSNNNTTKFQLPLQFFFAHATLLKAGPGLQYILNIITVAGRADAIADEKFQDPHISARGHGQASAWPSTPLQGH